MAQSSVTAVSFWSAVVLPIALVVFLATGMVTTSEWKPLLGVLLLHVGFLYLGHSYCQRAR